MNTNTKAAVVMFSDVVGYTRMMATDETATLALVQNSHRIQKELINKYTGHFIKEIGDGLLAWFDKPEDALSCCVEIQTIHSSLNFNIRIGLHKATIIIESDDIFGDGVNIASRIEPLADPGGIYISEELFHSLQFKEGHSALMMGKAKLKNVKTPITIYAIQGKDLPVPNKRRFQRQANPKRKLTAIPTFIVFFLVLGLLTFLTVNHFKERENIQKARNSLTGIEQLVQNSWRDFSEAYALAMKAKKWIPDDPVLQELIKQSSLEININTEPQGADVFIKKYSEPDAPWERLGTTPIASVRLPISIYRWKLEKNGYETVLAAATTFDFKVIADMRKENLFKANNFFRKLDTVGSIPEGMTRVTGSQKPYGVLDDFFIDKFEVTNKDYKKFVDAGAYKNKEFWKVDFMEDNRVISWEEAIKKFTDKTGLPGPATWKNSTYQKGKENFPVSGVSWYEAKAYADFVNKELPTGDHWGLARGENTFIIRYPQMGGYALFAPFSNFNNARSVSAGNLNGITSYGAYDMAGNVQEWCINPAPAGKLIRGGSWKSNTYMFSHLMQAPAFDRSETNGFRCVWYRNKDSLPQQAFQTANLGFQGRDPATVTTVSDEIFNVYKALYEYDRTPLNAEIISGDKSNPEWIHQRVSIDAVYGNERIILHLFLPKNAKAPYQTVLYGPGSASFFQLNSKNIADYYEFPVFLNFIVKSGRAVVYPVVQGTFERRKDITALRHNADESLQFSEFMIQVVKDYRRTIDYLETRKDIDPLKIGFYGMSWGPFAGTLLSPIENRIKVNVFVSGGIGRVGRPEVNQWNFAPRVKAPTLMINGRYDSTFPINLSIEPFYNTLGVAEGQKRLALFDTDHIPPREEMITETLSWLDKYLGHVN